jgi:hypothetical protein
MELTGHSTNRPTPAERRSAVATIMFALLLVAWIGEAPVEHDTALYSGLWRSALVVFGPLFAPLPLISLTPWQLLLIALAPLCLGGANQRQHAREMDRAILLSVTCVAITFLWGMLRGGSAYFAYYQVWRFLAALLVAYMLMSVVRAPRDLYTLGRVIVFAALTRATLCIYFYWAHLRGKFDPLPQYVTSHDDSLLFVAATLIVSSWAILKGGKAAWRAAALVVPYVFYAMVLNDRRVAWVELLLAIPLIYVLIGAGPLRTQINKWLVRTSPLVLIYVVVGSGSEAAIFAPLHALGSAGSNYDPSSLTRQEEVRNLLYTMTASGNPLLGTGWGLPYIKHESVWSNYSADWILYLYTPHNSLLGLAIFSGLLGIVGIWGVIPVAAYLAARGYRGSTEPVPRAAAVVAIGSLVAYSVHCYGDIGLQSLAGCVLFGAALAAAGKTAAWSEALPAAQTLAADAPSAPGPRPAFRGIEATRSGNNLGAKPNAVSTR